MYVQVYDNENMILMYMTIRIKEADKSSLFPYILYNVFECWENNIIMR